MTNWGGNERYYLYIYSVVPSGVAEVRVEVLVRVGAQGKVEFGLKYFSITRLLKKRSLCQ